MLNENRMRTLRLHICDFWPGFDPQRNYFVRLLRQSFELIFDSVQPELVIYSAFGAEHRKYYCRRLSFLGENLEPDFGNCDYAISFRSKSAKNYRLPLYALFDDVRLYESDRRASTPLPEGFCNFLYSNPGPRERVRFFELLNSYKKVDAGGRVRNNLGYRVSDKMHFLSQYRFSIAFENGSYPGYVTEKIFQPLIAGSIPIYWGANDIEKEFNAEAFINCHRYADFNEVVDRIRDLEAHPERIQQMREQPIFPNGKAPAYCYDESVLEFLVQVIEDTSTPVAQSHSSYTWPSFAQSLAHRSAALDYTLRLQLRRLIQLRPEKFRFRSASYSINNRSDENS